METHESDPLERPEPPELDPDETGADYAAGRVFVTVGPREVTGDAIMFIVDGWLVLAVDGEGSIVDRIIAAAPASGVTVVSKPKIGMGAAIRLRFPEDAHVIDQVPKRDGEWLIDVLPEAHYRQGFATPGKIKRARSSVRDLEEALARAKAA